MMVYIPWIRSNNACFCRYFPMNSIHSTIQFFRLISSHHSFILEDHSSFPMNRILLVSMLLILFNQSSKQIGFHYHLREKISLALSTFSWWISYILECILFVLVLLMLFHQSCLLHCTDLSNRQPLFPSPMNLDCSSALSINS